MVADENVALGIHCDAVRVLLGALVRSEIFDPCAIS